jgi:hypothetical protein
MIGLRAKEVLPLTPLIVKVLSGILIRKDFKRAYRLTRYHPKRPVM